MIARTKMSRLHTALLFSGIALAATSCSPPANGDHHGVRTASAELIARDRTVAGTAHFSEGPEGVVIRITVSGLPADARGRWQGAHLHRIGDCSNADFTSSGSHINPSGRQHGLLNPEGPDNADLPNLWAGEDGGVHAEVYSTRISLTGAGDRPALLDEDGSAFVMHAQPDDHTSQPIGGAGARILCGVIQAD